MKITNVTIGADPELFFLESKTDIPRSAEGLLGGDKEHPVPMYGLPQGFFVQEDNAAAEFNIPPAKTMVEFTKNINLSLKYIQGIARKNKLKLAYVPDLDFPRDQLMTKHCQTLGCDPDFNAWIEQENPRPQAPELMRTAAGHIHIGWSKPDWQTVMYMVKLFDLFVTVPSLLATEPNRRRQLYGRAGACRPKSYGVECRSVDNFWLAHRGHQTTLYSNVMFAIDIINEQNPLMYELVEDYAGIIIEAINTHNKEQAAMLCDKFSIPLFREP